MEKRQVQLQTEKNMLFLPRETLVVVKLSHSDKTFLDWKALLPREVMAMPEASTPTLPLGVSSTLFSTLPDLPKPRATRQFQQRSTAPSWRSGLTGSSGRS